MNNLKESIRSSINKRLKALEREENKLNSYYYDRMRVANDNYYAGIARSKARKEAEKAQQNLDNIINRKIELMKELQAL